MTDTEQQAAEQLATDIGALLAEAEAELGRPLDGDEAQAITDDYLEALDDAPIDVEPEQGGEPP